MAREGASETKTKHDRNARKHRWGTTAPLKASVPLVPFFPLHQLRTELCVRTFFFCFHFAFQQVHNECDKTDPLNDPLRDPLKDCCHSSMPQVCSGAPALLHQCALMPQHCHGKLVALACSVPCSVALACSVLRSLVALILLWLDVLFR